MSEHVTEPGDIDEPCIVEQLRDACTGKPATVAWPHRLLHDAADEIRKLSKLVDAMNASNMRDIKHWQKPTGNNLIWPEQSDLVAWLLDRQPQFGEWQDIATAPTKPTGSESEDGPEIILSRWGWLNDTTGMRVDSKEWRERIFDAEAPRKYMCWWICKGHWSTRWNNWNDGIEPSELADPTHWMHIPSLEPPK